MKKADALAENLAFLRRTEAALKNARAASPRFEAETLVRYYGGLSRIELFAGSRSLAGPARRLIGRAVARRAKGEPLHYVMGEATFYGHRFRVTPDTLIPRPETEVLVETAARALEAHFPPPERPQILDIGTGCGCIAICLTILRPECRMTALDVSERALGVARQNAVSLGARGICFKKSDLFSAFGKRHKGYWDLIVSNPPYIPGPEIAGLSREVRSEPRVALDGGREGLDLILAILDRAPYFLKPGGFLLLEIGKGQAAALGRRLKRDARWARHEFLKDYPGVRRVLRARAA